MLRFILISEKLNIKFVDPGGYTGLPSAEERLEMEQTQTENRRFLKIPRRSAIIAIAATSCKTCLSYNYVNVHSPILPSFLQARLG